MLTGPGLDTSPLNAPQNSAALQRGLQALRQSLVAIYRQRFGRVPARVEDALRRLTDPSRLETLVSIFLRGSAEEIGKVLLGVIAPAARAPAPGEGAGRELPAPAREDKRKAPEAEREPPPAPWPGGGGPGGNRTHVLAD